MLATAGGSPGWLLGPLRALGADLAAGPLAGALFYAGLWLALAAYAVVLVCARGVPRRALVAAILAVHLIFLLAPPLLSQDAFSYLAYARLGALHGLDPYASAPLDIPGDPVFGFAGSKGAASVYGPLFTLLTYPLALASVPVAFWTLKAVAAAGSLGAVALVARAVEQRGRDPRRALALVGLNPALLVHVVSAAHNEALLMLGTAGALLAFERGRGAAAAALGTGTAAIKASAGLVVPFLVAAARRAGGRAPDRARGAAVGADPRRRVLAAAVAAGAVAVAALAVGFAGFGPDAFGWLAAARANQARTSSFSLPHKTAELLGAILPGDRLDFRDAVRAAYALAFLPVAAWLLRRTWRGADAVAMAGWATVALLLCSAWLVPWYIAWLLPLAAVAGRRRLTAATVLLTAWMLAVAIPF